MRERKNEFCARLNCKKSGLSKSILMSNGCTKYLECEDFFCRENKIKDKIITLFSSCFYEKRCHKQDKEKVDTGCIDCRDFHLLSTGERGRKIDFHIRCLDEYCEFGKSSIDKKCLDCNRCRIFSDKKHVWIEFRGGKDLKGKNL